MENPGGPRKRELSRPELPDLRFCSIVINSVRRNPGRSIVTSTSAERELAFLSASESVERFRKKTLSPVDVTSAILARLERLEPKLNAFVLRDPEGALKAARASEARWQKGQPLGPVDGVTATIKDLFLTKGWPTLRGSTLTKRDQPWEEDAPP